MISRVANISPEAQHLLDLARLRRLRDRIDREYAQPLGVDLRGIEPLTSCLPSKRSTI